MSNKLYTGLCAYCGKEYTAKSTRAKYCSKECRREADKENKRIKYIGKRESVCVRCGKLLPKYKTRFCSVACRRGSGEHIKACIVCGKEFTTTRSRTLTCSELCSKRNYYAKKVSKSERYRDITIDKDISIAKLAIRDGGICQICKKPVQWDDKREINGQVLAGDYYPSVDHIKPISRGGLHSWDNIQLAHRICNSLKSNIVV